MKFGANDGCFKEEQPWISELRTAGEKPLAVGLVIAAIVVVAALAFSFAGAGTTQLSLDSASDSPSSSAQSGSEGDLVATGSVYVHVVGAVEQPGVYALQANARVIDAVEAAGGFRDDAAQDSLNLARTVADGEQICVPTAAEVQAAAESSEAEAAGLSGASGTSGTSMVVNGKVNINAADSATLQTLSGIGPSTAEKIIADREANGPFAAPEDLKRVSGIGDKKYAAIADAICVG